MAQGSLFNHAFEPTVTITPDTIHFSTTCVSRLEQRCVEVLFNPVERMLAVRPCADGHPNALRWVDRKGKGASLGAKAFCTILYQSLGWATDYTFRVPAVLRTRGDERILFFDLDNYIGRKTSERQTVPEEAPVEGDRRAESEETRGIFFGADDEEITAADDTAEVERRLRERAEYEKRHFGTPAFEHNSDFRLTAIDDDGEWEVMAEARPLSGDHRVDPGEIEALQEALIDRKEAPHEHQEPGTEQAAVQKRPAADENGEGIPAEPSGGEDRDGLHPTGPGLL